MIHVDFESGHLQGDAVLHSERRLEDLVGLFADEAARESMDGKTLAYRVEMHEAEKEGVEGGLFFGTSHVMPGKVGDEYFMTKGHLHAKVHCAEYYWGLSGTGWLLLMDENRNTRYEPVSRGSLHYIPGGIAHRLVNVGEEPLSVGACWPSDAGHDYGSIATDGFSARVLDQGSGPVLIQD